MDKQVTDVLRQMVYASMSTKDIASSASVRFGLSPYCVSVHVKVLQEDYLKWGISCPFNESCKIRQCRQDMLNKEPIRCAHPM